jgi:CRP-like cAMP-binding protein
MNAELLNHLPALSNTLQGYLNFSAEELMMTLPYMKLETLKKNDLLIGEGQVEDRIYYIAEGVTRSFFFENGKEISLEFYFTGSFISSYTSFVKQSPSRHSIEAFTPLQIIIFNRAGLAELFGKSDKFAKLWQKVSEELFIKTSERLRDMLSLSATERYLKLLKAYPKYVQEIPLKYLASYLNITPESLSRIRKNI